MLCLSLAAGALAAPFLTQEYVARLNARPGALWAAAVHPRFATVTAEEIEAKQAGGSPAAAAARRPVPAGGLPEHVDWREERPECLGAVLDQGGCGNCWAFAVTQVLTDRRCLEGRDAERALLSVAYLTACDQGNQMHACRGGNILFASTYLTEHGTVPASCAAFDDKAALVATCPKACDDGSALPYFTRAKGWKNVGSGGHSNITGLMQALATGGPLAACFNDYASLMAYRSGVYEPLPGEPSTGTHCCEIVGYGVDTEGADEVPYWIVRNSWGQTWGEAGYFRMLRGQNTCQMEEDAAEIYV